MQKIIYILIICIFLSGCASIKGPISGKKYGLSTFGESREKAQFYYYDKPAYKQECREYYVNEHPDISPQIKTSIQNGKLLFGMTKEQVIATWGIPDDVNRTMTASQKSEQWIYGFAGVNVANNYVDYRKYLYFDDDILSSFQD